MADVDRRGDVSVVILTWNDGDLLAEAIASVGAPDLAVEIVVVDNGSDVPAAVEGSVRLVRLEENRGVAAGRNVGARAAEGAILCFLDSDARLEPGSLEELVEALRSSPDLGLVAPVFAGQPPTASGGRAPTLLRKAARGFNLIATYAPMRRGDEHRWDVDFTIGACQVIRRSAFDDVGGLDERYFYGPEDVDFCLRLRERGWRIVQVDVEVFHPPRRRFRRLWSKQGAKHGIAIVQHLWRHRRRRRHGAVGA